MFKCLPLFCSAAKRPPPDDDGDYGGRNDGNNVLPTAGRGGSASAAAPKLRGPTVTTVTALLPSPSETEAPRLEEEGGGESSPAPLPRPKVQRQLSQQQPSQPLSGTTTFLERGLLLRLPCLRPPTSGSAPRLDSISCPPWDPPPCTIDQLQQELSTHLPWAAVIVLSLGTAASNNCSSSCVSDCDGLKLYILPLNSSCQAPSAAAANHIVGLGCEATTALLSQAFQVVQPFPTSPKPQACATCPPSP